MQVYVLTIQVPQSGRSFQMNHLRRCLLAESTPLPQETKYGLQSKTVQHGIIFWIKHSQKLIKATFLIHEDLISCNRNNPRFCSFSLTHPGTAKTVVLATALATASGTWMVRSLAEAVVQ